MRPSCLYIWNPYTGKTTSLYWDSPLQTTMKMLDQETTVKIEHFFPFLPGQDRTVLDASPVLSTHKKDLRLTTGANTTIRCTGNRPVAWDLPTYKVSGC